MVVDGSIATDRNNGGDPDKQVGTEAIAEVSLPLRSVTSFRMPSDIRSPAGVRISGSSVSQWVYMGDGYPACA